MEKTSSQPLFSERRIAAVHDRAIRIGQSGADFLIHVAAQQLEERLSAITRDLNVAADVFSPFDGMSKVLEAAPQVQQVVRLVQGPAIQDPDNESGRIEAPFDLLPFKPASLNLITSLFSLHRSNQLPGTLKRIRESLIPDGVFLAVMPGDRTLKELRQSLIEAESKLTGAVNLRVDPFAEVRQYGALLQAAGFALPVVDTELITVRYSALADLIKDLRAMGATSAFSNRSAPCHRDLFRQTEELLIRNHSDDDGKFRITVEMVFLSGWAPHASQQKPLKPGSAENLLKDHL